MAVLEVTTNTSHVQFTKPGYAEQPNVGGWHTKTGQYFNVRLYTWSIFQDW